MGPKGEKGDYGETIDAPKGPKGDIGDPGPTFIYQRPICKFFKKFLIEYIFLKIKFLKPLFKQL